VPHESRYADARALGLETSYIVSAHIARVLSD
jgi:hypothetical protein